MGRRSRSVTWWRSSASRVAAASPAKPPPTTTTRISARERAQLRRSELADRDRHLLAARHLRSAVPDVEPRALELLEEGIVDVAHDLGNHELAALGAADGGAGAQVVRAGALRLELHHASEAGPIPAGEQVLFGDAERAQVLGRQIDAAAARVLGHVAEDV